MKPHARAKAVTQPYPDDGRWHYRRSLASRVGVLTALAVGVSIGVMAMTAFLVMRMQLMNSMDESLFERAERASESTLSEIGNDDVPSWMLGATDVRVILLTSQGLALSSDEHGLPLGEPELHVANGTSKRSIRTVTDTDGVQYRAAAVPAGVGGALVLAQPLTSQHQTLNRLSTVLLIYGGLGVGAAALAGWAVATNGLRPVRRLTAAVEQIAVTEKLSPLRVEGDDEVARLSTAFNQMLLALSSSQNLQRRLIADASHELRTPLTSLRTNLDLLRQAEQREAEGVRHGLDAQARAELLDDVRAQIEEFTALVDDLVMLARDHQPSEVVAQVDLAAVTERALTRVRRRAPGITFDVDIAGWIVRGDPGGLERAVTNLLDNAAKWSPDGGTVTVQLDHGMLTIDDQGPGISPADRAHVFKRFFRSEDSRAMPGSGLGLAIVHQVVIQHGGRVAVQDAPGGGARLAAWLPGTAPTVLDEDDEHDEHHGASADA